MDELWQCYNSPSGFNSSDLRDSQPATSSAAALDTTPVSPVFQTALPHAFRDFNDENQDPGQQGSEDLSDSPAEKKPRKEWEFVATCEGEAALEELKASLLCGSRKWTRKSIHQSVDLFCVTEVLKCVEVRKCHCTAQIKVVAEGGKYVVYKSAAWHDHTTYFGAGLSHAQRQLIEPLVKSRQAQPRMVERTLRDAGMPVESKVLCFPWLPNCLTDKFMTVCRW